MLIVLLCNPTLNNFFKSYLSEDRSACLKQANGMNLELYFFGTGEYDEGLICLSQAEKPNKDKSVCLGRIMIKSKFYGTSTPKGSYSAKTGESTR